MSESRTSLSLFQEEELAVSVNGVKAVNSIDIYDLEFHDKFDKNNFVKMKNYVNKGEYIIHSSGAYHPFKDIHLSRNSIPKYFSEPVFPWIQTVYKRKMRTPGPTQNMVYPYVSLGKNVVSSKKCLMHVLVAAAFVHNDDPKNKIWVGHINDIKWDYRPKNLTYLTPKKNSVGTFKDRRMSTLEIYDKWFNEFKYGRDYDVVNFEDDEEHYL